MPQPEFNQGLNRIMKSRGVTVLELSKRSGVGRSQIYRITGGWNEPNWATIRKFARALGVDVWDFYGYDGAETVPLDETGFEVAQILQRLGPAGKERVLRFAEFEEELLDAAH